MDSKRPSEPGVGWAEDDEASSAASPTLPNYNKNYIENLDVDKAIINMENAIRDKLMELEVDSEAHVKKFDLPNNLMGDFANLFDNCMQDMRKDFFSMDKYEKHEFLKRGFLNERLNKAVQEARARRDFLEEQSKNQNSKDHIVYSRISKGAKRARPKFNADCAHTTKSNAMPKGYHDRMLVESLKRAADRGDVKAQARLDRIFGITSTQSTDTKPPLFMTKTEKVEFDAPKCGAKTYRNERGEKMLVLTCTPRGEDDESIFTAENETEFNSSYSTTITGGIKSSSHYGSTFSESGIRTRTTLADVLPWYTDFQLKVDDRFLQAAEFKAWKDIENAQKRAEVEAWLALPEKFPSVDETDTTILRTELRVASCLSTCWLDSKTNLLKSTVEFQVPPPTDWDRNVYRWWVSKAGASSREVYLQNEIENAVQDNYMISEALKAQIISKDCIPQVSFAKSRKVKERKPWRKFRDWYFSKASQIHRKHLLSRELMRIQKAWKTSWVQWQLFWYSDKPSDDQSPVRWRCVQSFQSENEFIQGEYKFVKAWSSDMNWVNMSEEEREMEVKAAMCDRVIRSMAQADGVFPPSNNADPNNMGNPDEDDSTSLMQQLEDPQIMKRLLFWFPGNTPIREAYLKREFKCALKDFAQEHKSFGTEKETLKPLRQRLSVRMLQESIQVVKRLREKSRATISDRRSTRSFGSDSEVSDDEGDTTFVEYDDSQGEEETDIDFLIRNKIAKVPQNDVLQRRRREAETALKELRVARRLFEQVQESATKAEEEALITMHSEYEQEVQKLQGNCSKQTQETLTRTDLNMQSRLRKLQEIEEKCREDIELAKIHKTSKEIATRRERAALCKEYRSAVEAIEISCRLVQRKVLEIIRASINEAADTKESQPGGSERLVLLNGKKVTVAAPSERWDSSDVAQARRNLRKAAIKQMKDFLVSNGQRVDIDSDFSDDDEDDEGEGASDGSECGSDSEYDEEQEDEAYEIDLDNPAQHSPSDMQRATRLRRETMSTLRFGGIALVDSKLGTRTKLEEEEEVKLREHSSKLLEKAGKNLTQVGGKQDANFEEFRDWYGSRKQLRSTFLKQRLTLYTTYETTMIKRGEGSKMNNLSLFDAEENLMVPEMSNEAKRRRRRKRALLLYPLEDLEEDDAVLREAEMAGRLELEEELVQMYRDQMERMREKLKIDLANEIANEDEEARRQHEREMEEARYLIEQQRLAALKKEAEERMAREQQIHEAELERLRQEEVELARQQRAEAEREKEVILMSANDYNAHDETPVERKIEDEFSFVDSYDKNETLRLMDMSKYSHGDGTNNGDEEYFKLQLELAEQRAFEAAEREREKAERHAMQIEDEYLKKFYVLERRALLLAEEESAINRLVALQREEERQRREHASGMCFRELLVVDRQQMLEEEVDNKKRWQIIEEHEREQARLAEERETAKLQAEAEEQERLWRDLEARRERERIDKKTAERELPMMGVEDLKSGLLRPKWEEERYLLHRLRWMEDIAYAKFDPFFKTPLGEPTHLLKIQKEKKKLPNSCTARRRDDRDTDEAMRASEDELLYTTKVKDQIKFATCLSNKFQQLLGLPSNCRVRAGAGAGTRNAPGGVTSGARVGHIGKYRSQREYNNTLSDKDKSKISAAQTRAKERIRSKRRHQTKPKTTVKEKVPVGIKGVNVLERNGRLYEPLHREVSICSSLTTASRVVDNTALLDDDEFEEVPPELAEREEKSEEDDFSIVINIPSQLVSESDEAPMMRGSSSMLLHGNISRSSLMNRNSTLTRNTTISKRSTQYKKRTTVVNSSSPWFDL